MDLFLFGLRQRSAAYFSDGAMLMQA